MSKKPSSFQITALKRALIGTRAAGLSVQRIRVDKTGADIIIGEPLAAPDVATADVANPWDDDDASAA